MERFVFRKNCFSTRPPRDMTSWTFAVLLVVFFSLGHISCVSSRKIAYLSDLPDSTRIASADGLEAIIQKKDILSISVSSLSNEATIIFNAPNLPITPGAGNNNLSQTAGYLVSDNGTIKFPVLGDLPAAGLTQKELENNITRLLIEKKLLYDPIVSSRFLNFRVTVLGEVNRPGVINVPGEQINILEAIGQAGDLTIYARRDNVMLIRQQGQSKLIKRFDLGQSNFLSSPYFFLKSNDVIYIEPGSSKIASLSQARQLVPVFLSGLSLVVIILNSLLK